MATPISDLTYSQRFKLLAASDFVDTNGKIVHYRQNRVEKLGRFFRWGVGSVLDFFLKNYKEPVMVIALGAISMFVIAIIFYHTVIFTGIITILPFMAYVLTPTVLKASCYVIIQTTAIGIILRAAGRVFNPNFMEHYCKGDYIPIFVGHKKV